MTRWNAVPGGWITDDQLGRICDLSCRNLSYFAMWTRTSVNEVWEPVTTIMGKVTYRRTLQAAMLEAERDIAFHVRPEAA